MSCIIFGAGKIARGFIGHLLYLSGIPFSFIEKSPELTDLINHNQEYHIHILGAPEKDILVSGVKAFPFEDMGHIAAEIRNSDIIFTAVGGKNLEEIAPIIAAGIEVKSKTSGGLNIITCENWKQPADLLKTKIIPLLSADAAEYFQQHVGITEAVVMRSAIEPDPDELRKDPLSVNVQDYWELPVDASRIKGNLPAIQGLQSIDGFSGFLERKFYTYNAANATVSYIGALLGYKKIAEAAHDSRIQTVLDGVYDETSKALSAKHHFPLQDQIEFTKGSLKKLQDYTIIDFIERNARDPIRKLGYDDRLVGSARMVLEQGIIPENLSISIAAAIYYKSPGDPFAEKLEKLRNEKGIEYILSEICGLNPEGVLGQLIQRKIQKIKEKGWIHE